MEEAQRKEAEEQQGHIIPAARRNNSVHVLSVFFGGGRGGGVPRGKGREGRMKLTSFQDRLFGGRLREDYHSIAEADEFVVQVFFHGLHESASFEADTHLTRVKRRREGEG